MAEKLNQEQIDRLASYGITYPWSPWDVLQLLDIVEDLQERLREHCPECQRSHLWSWEEDDG